MCFYIYRKHKKVKIAKKDIVCYKRVEYKRINGSYFSLFSLVQNYRYSLKNKIPKVKLEKKGDCIYDGYHSYVYKKENLNLECIIPKGSEYYYNPERNEYVSDQIQIKRIRIGNYIHRQWHEYEKGLELPYLGILA